MDVLLSVEPGDVDESSGVGSIIPEVGEGEGKAVVGDGVIKDVPPVVRVEIVSNLSKASCKSSSKLDFSTARTMVDTQKAVVAKAKKIATFFAVNTKNLIHILIQICPN